MRTRRPIVGVRFSELVDARPRTLVGALTLLSATSTDRESRLIEVDEGGWSATDEELNVASQGETREEALEMLDEAVALHKGEIGEPVTDEDLRELGIGPESVPDEPQEPDAPWFDSEEWAWYGRDPLFTSKYGRPAKSTLQDRSIKFRVRVNTRGSVRMTAR